MKQQFISWFFAFTVVDFPVKMQFHSPGIALHRFRVTRNPVSSPKSQENQHGLAQIRKLEPFDRLFRHTALLFFVSAS